MDTVTEGTVPTPNLNAFSWRILMGANSFPAASRLIELGWSDVVPHTPLLLQLANWGEPKVLHAMKMCQIQVVFHDIACLPCSSSSRILCHSARHKAD